MNCDIYKSENNQNMYLFVPAGSELNVVPSEVLSQFGELEFFESKEISHGQPLFGVNPREAISNIANSGYHVQRVTIEFEENENSGA